MKVALSADGAEFGGAEQSLVNLVRKVGGRHSFVLLGPDCAAMRGLTERLPSVPATMIVDRGLSLREKIARRQKALNTHRPDFLQVTLCNPGAGRKMQLAAHLARVPTIAIEQLVRPLTGRRQTEKTLVSRLLVDHVAVGGASAREVEQLFGLPAASVRTIYNGVPDRGFEGRAAPGSRAPDSGAAGGHRDSRFTIGSVGRLEHQKGYDRLIDALPHLPDAQLVFVGDGSLRGDLQRQVDDLGIGDRVQFLGWLDDPSSALSTFDLFVLPSRNEAFPLTIVEAMLVGIPVVASDVGSVSEAVTHGETGWLVPEGDVPALTATLKTVLADDVARSRVSAGALERARTRFTDDAMAAHYCEMWESPRGRLGWRERSVG